MKDFLDFASNRYYSGNPVITDDEFDRLADKYDYKSVGAVLGDTPHTYPMWSLQKYYIGEDVPTGNFFNSSKLDGAAIALYYLDGILVQALTRGNGKKGQDITDKARLLKGVLQRINFGSQYQIIQITGEVVAPREIPNARNYAAGALNLKDLEEFSNRDIEFIAYGVYPYQRNLYSETLELLEDNGFYTVANKDYINKFPQDGEVYRENDNQKFESLGYTSKHPRGAFALKQNKEGTVTTLLDVTWQVGRTGVVSPVAILKPVDIDGAVVGKATLHNIKYINDLNLEIGCKVRVLRAGEIIPRVLERVYD